MSIKLKDLCELIVDCPHSTEPNEGQGYPIIRTPNIGPGYLNLDGVQRVGEEAYKRRNVRAVPQAGDLILAREAPAGNVGIIPDGEKVCLGQRTVLIRPDRSKADPAYLNYYLNAPKQRHKLLSNSNGATVSHVNMPIIHNLPVDLPPLPAQKRIAGVLSAYDKLIENNRRQIKLLEEAAQRLYKEWFVDLRFPGHETTPIHNGVPEGWKRTTVGKICELIRDSSRPDERNESTMYIGLEHMPKNSICLNMYGDVSSVTGSKLNFRKNDILFGKIRPYFHKVGFAQCNGVTSTDTLVMRAKPNCFGLLLEIVSSDVYVAYATATSKTGTKMPRADWNAMSAYELLEPSARVLAQFDGFVKQITDEIMNLSDQIVAAREARDRLLPKLMSGEIEV